MLTLTPKGFSVDVKLDFSVDLLNFDFNNSSHWSKPPKEWKLDLSIHFPLEYIVWEVTESSRHWQSCKLWTSLALNCFKRSNVANFYQNNNKLTSNLIVTDQFYSYTSGSELFSGHVPAKQNEKNSSSL